MTRPNAPEDLWAKVDRSGGPKMNLHRLPPDDEAMLREHHATDGGYERCVICRLLATLDYEREARQQSAIGVLDRAVKETG